MSDKKKFQPAEIVWFNDAKGCGYAKDADGNLIFIHYSAIEDNGLRKTLTASQKIQLQAEDDLGELRALKVRRELRDA